MAKYEVTYRCGHTGIVQLYGKTKDRERKLEWMSNSVLCEDCQKIEFAKQNALAAMDNRASGLPPLTGTEKQAAWAESLRAECHKALTAATTPVELLRMTVRHAQDLALTEEQVKTSQYNTPETARALMQSLIDKLFTEQTKASYWIDRRPKLRANGDIYDWDEVTDELIKQFAEAVKAAAAPAAEAAKPEQTQQPGTPAPVEPPKPQQVETLAPERPTTSSIVKINYTSEEVTAITDKSEAFRKIVKDLGYEWNGTVWMRKLTARTGAAQDRAAELGNALLRAGFSIQIDTALFEKAINGSFEPECKRWISRLVGGEYTGRFAIVWGGYDDKMYNLARKLPGAKWHQGKMLVKPEHFEAVEDFARLYGFRFSEGGQALLAEAKAARAAALTVTPATPTTPEKKDGLKEVLNSSDEIIADLEDKDMSFKFYAFKELPAGAVYEELVGDPRVGEVDTVPDHDICMVICENEEMAEEIADQYELEWRATLEELLVLYNQKPY